MIVKGYCLRCKSIQEIIGQKTVSLKNNRNAISGICDLCGRKMMKIIGKNTSLSDRDYNKTVDKAVDLLNQYLSKYPNK